MSCDFIVVIQSKMAASMKCFLVSALLGCLVINVHCHLCLVSPKQRGSMNGLNKAGSPDCLLTKPQCGGRQADPSSITLLRAGENFTVTFQKNLNHYTQKSPGEFRIMLGQEETGKFESLAVVKDNNEPAPYLYSVSVTIPSYRLKQHLVLQAVYVTNNPDAPPMFYQCSDVIITDKY